MNIFKQEQKKAATSSVLPNSLKHVAIIMDGNGRWATKRFLPRVAGHAKGVQTVHNIVEACSNRGISYLTLFAFSSENWKRPQEEVSLLMRLFREVLSSTIKKMRRNNVRLKVIGDLSRFDSALQELIVSAETDTAANTGLTLTICANYGGKWDIVNACNKIAKSGVPSGEITEEMITQNLSMAYAPDPDLLIRTGGESRVSNYLLWQLAYSEFYFTDTFWPDFNEQALDLAIESYQCRERRFGKTSAQVCAG